MSSFSWELMKQKRKRFLHRMSMPSDATTPLGSRESCKGVERKSPCWKGGVEPGSHVQQGLWPVQLFTRWRERERERPGDLIFIFCYIFYFLSDVVVSNHRHDVSCLKWRIRHMAQLLSLTLAWGRDFSCRDKIQGPRLIILSAQESF